ncbi:MAG: ABC transporter substrate-binding protein [Alcaligenaceae bacterium]|jgi:NitT/TauT family transport system substrate-binding protein|nr:ABC transporter substrate-binding protein [Alcaligenaceae bacterium]
MSSRREFLKLCSLFTAAGSMPLLQKAAFANVDPDAPLRIGYLPITDATPLLVAHANGYFEEAGVKVEKPVMFRSWAQLVEAFLAGQVNIIHLLSPMTVWARFGGNAPVKNVMWNHLSGSAITVLPEIDKPEDLGGHTVAIPFWYSIHNVLLQHVLREHGLKITESTPGPDEVKLLVMAPADMVAALAARNISGFTVAEPFNAAAELNGVGKILRFSGDVWREHACCVTLMRDEDILQRPEWVQRTVNALVRAQAWTLDHREETAQLMSRRAKNRYTPHDEAALLKVLAPAAEDEEQYISSGAIKHPEWRQQRIDFQPYPYESYYVELIKMLQSTYIAGEHNFLDDLDPHKAGADLVDSSFVRKALESPELQAKFNIPADFKREEQIAV